jgi:hypothetical protein
MRRFFLRLANLFRGISAETEMSREIDAHLALLQDEFETRGMPPKEARLAARRAYGGVEQTKELHRETRSFIWIEQIFKDVRYGWRNLLLDRQRHSAEAAPPPGARSPGDAHQHV